MSQFSAFTKKATDQQPTSNRSAPEIIWPRDMSTRARRRTPWRAAYRVLVRDISACLENVKRELS